MGASKKELYSPGARRKEFLAVMNRPGQRNRRPFLFLSISMWRQGYDRYKPMAPKDFLPAPKETGHSRMN